MIGLVLFMALIALIQVVAGGGEYVQATTIFQEIEGAVIGCFGLLSMSVLIAALYVAHEAGGSTATVVTPPVPAISPAGDETTV